VASLGIPYRFQHPITPYFADYAFPTLGLILEIDGSSHSSEAAKAKDAERDARLLKRGWRVVRVTNRQAMVATRSDLESWLGL
jgi:very-short-patch-repair endonuclease